MTAAAGWELRDARVRSAQGGQLGAPGPPQPASSASWLARTLRFGNFLVLPARDGGWHSPQTKAVLRVVRVGDEMAAAAAAGGHLQHAGVEKAHQRPRAGQTEHRLVVVQLARVPDTAGSS